MKNKLTIAMIIVAGLAAVYGVYWFRTSRLTTASYAEFLEQQERVAAIDQESAADRQYSTDPKEEVEDVDTRKRRQESAAVLAEAKANAPTTVDPNAQATRINEAPPEITIVPRESMPEQTPPVFTVLFETTKGPFAVQFTREWAPNGVDRMYQLVREKFFSDMRVFRAVENFVIQFGISGDPAVSKAWEGKDIPDDPVTQSNTEGMVTFAAASAPNTRSTQIFVNLRDNSRSLDPLGFAPIGKVTFGLDVAKSLYNGYGDAISELQAAIAAEGNAFLDKNFPELDSIKRAVFIEEIYDPNPDIERRRQLLRQTMSGQKPSTVVDERAPDTFKVKFDCTMGSFVVECTRAWSPVGADRFYTLVKRDFFKDAKFFRVVPDFIIQFGLPADPSLHEEIMQANIPDDPFIEKNLEGTIVFAKSGRPNSRTTQIFININDNTNSLDPQGFTPFGRVIEGMDVVKKINPEYGEEPSQQEIRARGNRYLEELFPRLDAIQSATLVE